MTDETSQLTSIAITQKFGDRLKSAREDLRLELKDVASQLRLREGIIDMLEKGMYSDDIPVTFLRGYLRSYAKFLDIPETELNSALAVDDLQPLPTEQPLEMIEPLPVRNRAGFWESYLGAYFDKDTVVFLSKHFKKYFMQIFTCIVVFTLFALVVTWWHSHKNPLVAVAPLPEQQTVASITAVAPKPMFAPEPTGATVGEHPAAQQMIATDQQEPTTAPESVALKSAPAGEKKLQLSMRTQKTAKVIDVYNE